MGAIATDLIPSTKVVTSRRPASPNHAIFSPIQSMMDWKPCFSHSSPAVILEQAVFQAFCKNAVTLSQFCQSRMRAAISAMMPTTTHVMGFASSAAVKDHTEAINPGMAVTAVTTACLAMLTRPSAMFFRAVTS